MSTLTLKSRRCATTHREAILYGRIPVGVDEYAVALAFLIDANGWTLQEYIDWINRPEPGMWKGVLMADYHWRNDYGITTASQLGDYLDGCHEREVQKEAMYS